MDEHPWPDQAPAAPPAAQVQPRPGLAESFRALGVNERIAVMAGAAAALSMVLPWYGVTVAGGAAKSGVGSFSFAEAALLVTVGSAMAMVLARGRGHDVPLPLHEGTLLVAAGAWASLIIVERMVDRPSFALAGVEQEYGLRYGVFIALAGSIAMAVAGWRRREEQVAAESPTASRCSDPAGRESR